MTHVGERKNLGSYGICEIAEVKGKIVRVKVLEKIRIVPEYEVNMSKRLWEEIDEDWHSEVDPGATVENLRGFIKSLPEAELEKLYEMVREYWTGE